MRSLRALVPASLVVLAPAMGLAQGQPAPSGQGAPSANAPAGAATAPAGSAGAAGAGDAQPPEVKVPATGYGYSDPKPARAPRAPRAHRRIAHAAGPVATLPGFEMLADGGSRLFVQLTQNVPVEEKRAAGTVTYVIKGAHVEKYNNERPLVTVHFNTPVSRARLVPSGRDLLFIVDLRAGVQPTWRIDAAKDGGAILAIDFPKGDYLPQVQGPAGPAANPDAPDGDTQSAPRPRARRSPKAAAPSK